MYLFPPLTDQGQTSTLSWGEDRKRVGLKRVVVTTSAANGTHTFIRKRNNTSPSPHTNALFEFYFCQLAPRTTHRTRTRTPPVGIMFHLDRIVDHKIIITAAISFYSITISKQ